MSLTLTPLGGDNFQYADVTPLPEPPWANLFSTKLQVVSHLCESASSSSTGGQVYEGVSLPNNQYASITLATVPFAFAGFEFTIRDNDSAVFGNCYEI